MCNIANIIIIKNNKSKLVYQILLLPIRFLTPNAQYLWSQKWTCLQKQQFIYAFESDVLNDSITWSINIEKTWKNAMLHLYRSFSLLSTGLINVHHRQFSCAELLLISICIDAMATFSRPYGIMIKHKWGFFNAGNVHYLFFCLTGRHLPRSLRFWQGIWVIS